MIEIQNVTKNYGEVRSLDDVTVTLRNGSIFGLVGSNGSGKSTLLRTLCGILRPDQGQILYDGTSVWDCNAVKEKIVFLADEPFFLPGSNLNEMANMFASLYASFDEGYFRKNMELFALPDKRRITTFSKGMQKQASLLLGLAVRPRYLFCDETFDGLDPVMRQAAKGLLAEDVAERGLTIVIASHNLRELEDLCDHVALLHKGKLLFEQDLDEMKFNLCRMQAVLTDEEAETIKRSLTLLHIEKRGSMYTIVSRGTREQIEDVIAPMSLKFYEFIPLTLEEIFLAEMEDRGYDSSKFLA